MTPTGDGDRGGEGGCRADILPGTLADPVPVVRVRAGEVVELQLAMPDAELLACDLLAAMKTAYLAHHRWPAWMGWMSTLAEAMTDGPWPSDCTPDG